MPERKQGRYILVELDIKKKTHLYADEIEHQYFIF